MSCHGPAAWQGDASSGGWAWHPSIHNPVLGGEGPRSQWEATPPCSHLPHCRDDTTP